MIGSIILKGEPQELFEGYSVADLGFQFRVGIDAEPLLEEEAFHKEIWHISMYWRTIAADALRQLPA